jgi:hypothetical protein
VFRRLDVEQVCVSVDGDVTTILESSGGLDAATRLCEPLEGLS